jgi:general secretion pathway protein N
MFPNSRPRGARAAIACVAASLVAGSALAATGPFPGADKVPVAAPAVGQAITPVEDPFAAPAPATPAFSPVAPRAQQPGQRSPRGNPLWSMPLSSFSATRERPIFSPSRRPPPVAVAAPRIEPVKIAAPVAPAAPEKPDLALIGVAAGATEAIAIFLDQTNQGVIRLRIGEAHSGWRLASVKAREAVLTKNGQVEQLFIKRKDDKSASGGPIAAPAVILPHGAIPMAPPPTPAASAAPQVPLAPPMPVVTSNDGSFAPYTPRSTPKDGSSDGL